MSLFDELVEVVKTLRGPDGCPWDKEQTHESLKPYFIEEVYEAIEAIDSGSDSDIQEELGDVLLQSVLHAEIARGEGRFDIDDVLRAIIEKLKRRHPHVFGDVVADNSQQVLKNWEAIKRKEKREKKDGGSVLDGLPKSLPALILARRIQEKVSRFGFDWEHTEDVLAKVDEELLELKEANKNNDRNAVEEELGDLLFAVTNMARFVSLCPEDALKKTIDKFQRRFQYIESELPKRGMKLGEASLEEMDKLWDEIKQKEKEKRKSK